MIFRNRLTRGAVALMALAAAVFAADTSGKILGTVKDPAGNLIPHAAATLQPQCSGDARVTRPAGRSMAQVWTTTMWRFIRSPRSRNRRLWRFFSRCSMPSTMLSFSTPARWTEHQ